MLRFIVRSSRRSRRDASAIASASRRGRSSPSTALPVPGLSRVRSQTDYGDFDYPPVSLPVDRRTFIPVQPGSRTLLDKRSESYYRPAKRFSGRPARVVAPPLAKRPQGRSRPFRGTSWKGLLFSQPATVGVCVQRGVRKEVLHAKGVAGSRARKRAPRRNAYSSISCR